MAQVTTITVSAVVSAIVSVITGTVAFGVGARSQKNVADRPLLRQTYQALFDHFTELKLRLVKGNPMTWASFKVIRGEYCPLVRQMEFDGRSNLLPPRLFETLKDAERKVVIAGSRLAHLVEEHATPHLRSMMSERVRSPTSSLSGRRFRPFSIAAVVVDPSDLQASEFDPDLGLGVETDLTSSRTAMYYAYPETVVVGEFADLVRKIAAVANLPELAEVSPMVTEARTVVAAACEALEARIRDPHPLHEAVADTLTDFWTLLRLPAARKS